jgi:hypothetical protein
MTRSAERKRSRGLEVGGCTWSLVRRRARRWWSAEAGVAGQEQGESGHGSGGFGYGGQGLGLPATKFSHQWSIGDCKLVVR